MKTTTKTTLRTRLYHHAVRSAVYGGAFLMLECNPAWHRRPESNEAFAAKGFLLIAFLFLGIAMSYHLWQTE